MSERVKREVWAMEVRPSLGISGDDVRMGPGRAMGDGRIRGAGSNLKTRRKMAQMSHAIRTNPVMAREDGAGMGLSLRAARISRNQSSSWTSKQSICLDGGGAESSPVRAEQASDGRRQSRRARDRPGISYSTPLPYGQVLRPRLGQYYFYCFYCCAGCFWTV